MQSDDDDEHIISDRKIEDGSTQLSEQKKRDNLIDIINI
jgi:hypothetical protein